MQICIINHTNREASYIDASENSKEDVTISVSMLEEILSYCPDDVEVTIEDL